MPIAVSQLTALIDQHWGTLVAWVGPEHGIAEDVVQEAFVRLASQDPVPATPVGWLFTVSRRLALNERKRWGRRERIERETAMLQKQSRVFCHNQAGSIDPEELQMHLNALDENQRQVLVAKIWGELNLDQIAASMGCSRSTVWRTYQDALQNLKQRYGQS